MHSTDPRRPYARLKRPRLLPVTIAAISALLAVKSAIMVEAVAGEAIPPAQASAQGPQAPSPAPPASTLGAAQPVGTPAPTVSPPVSEAERSLLMDLRQRRVGLDNRSHELDLRDAEIRAADHRLEDRVQQLSKLQEKLEGLEASRQRHSDENWAGLVKVYEAMKPREAATIFDSLDMQVLLQVMDRMQDRRAAPVLAAMQPDRARLVTQMLAEMRTRATTPKEFQ